MHMAGAVTHPCVTCGALSQDNPGPARRAPGVCLEEPRGADAVGDTPSPAWPPTPPPPGALQVRRQRAHFRGRAVRICLPTLDDKSQIHISAERCKGNPGRK